MAYMLVPLKVQATEILKVPLEGQPPHYRKTICSFSKKQRTSFSQLPNKNKDPLAYSKSGTQPKDTLTSTSHKSSN